MGEHIFDERDLPIEGVVASVAGDSLRLVGHRQIAILNTANASARIAPGEGVQGLVGKKVRLSVDVNSTRHPVRIEAAPVEASPLVREGLQTPIWGVEGRNVRIARHVATNG